MKNKNLPQTEFVSREFTDVKEANKIASIISSTTIEVKTVSEAFLEHFGYFKLSELQELILAPDPGDWIRNKWVVINRINTTGLDISTLIQSGLVHIPRDYNQLLNVMSSYKMRIANNWLGEYISDISEFFDSTERVINPMMEDDSEVYKKVQKKFTIRTETEQENRYMQVLDNLANSYTILLNEYKLSKQYVPIGFLGLTVFESGDVSVYPTFHSLNRFRKNNS